MSILDLRPADVFVRGHLPGAANIPADILFQNVFLLPPKGGSLQLYHNDGETAGQVAAVLQTRGYQAAILPEVDTTQLTEQGPARVRLWLPSPFLVEAWNTVSPGLARPIHIMDIGCGSGRDAVWLASQGCDVRAVDVLPDALENARKLAEFENVRIQTICQDVLKEPPSLQNVNVVCLIRFAHIRAVGPLLRGLPRGSYVVVEAFHARDASSGKGGRKMDRIFADGELRTMLEGRLGFEVVQGYDGVERAGRWFTTAVARRN